MPNIRWSGGRAVLVLNLAMLLVAVVSEVAGLYTLYQLLGRVVWVDSLPHFLPVLIAFMVRNRIVSSLFLLLSTALLIHMWHQAISIYLGIYDARGMKYPLEWGGYFLVFSIVVLVIYVASISLMALLRAVNRRRS